MTITRAVVNAVLAADADLPDLPLLTASARIAEQQHLPQHEVFAVLAGHPLDIQDIQERAA